MSTSNNRPNFDISFMTCSSEFTKVIKEDFSIHSEKDRTNLISLIDIVISELTQKINFDVTTSYYYEYRLYLFNINRDEKLTEPPFPTQSASERIIRYRLNFFESLKDRLSKKKGYEEEEIKILCGYLFYLHNSFPFKNEWFLKPSLNFSQITIEFLKENCNSFKKHLEDDSFHCSDFNGIDYLKPNTYSNFFRFPLEELIHAYDNGVFVEVEKSVEIELSILEKIIFELKKKKLDLLFYDF